MSQLNSILNLLAIPGMISIVFGLIAAFLLLLFRQRRERGYDEERHRAQLEMLRESFEQQIYDLTERLVATEQRWRDTNHLLISSQHNGTGMTAKPTLVVLSNFLKSLGISEDDLVVEHDLIMVLTPFHDKYDETFHEIALFFQKNGLRCLRGDETFVSGDLLPHIIRLIVKARLIIVNIDGRSPNVFYEMGLAHAMDKDMILIARQLNGVPFDVQSKRILIYQDFETLKSKLSEELIKIFARA
ncbi:MAG: hypothetical protein ACPGWR_17850 [Ardenticatenaceae bacterium]